MSAAEFIQGFVECALWLGKHYETEQAAENGDGTNLDDMFSMSDIPADVMAEIRRDCESFYSKYSHLWADVDGYDDSDAGQDFFLSRNGHGAGFWDHEFEHAQEAHDATKPYGCFGLESFGSDGAIHSHS